MEIGDLLDRRAPLAIAAAILLQSSTAVWWAATKDSEDRFREERIAHLEIVAAKTADGHGQVMERLARIEERMSAEAGVLDRIEKQLGTRRF